MKDSASLYKSGLTRIYFFQQLARNHLCSLIHIVNNIYLKKSFSEIFSELTR